MRHRETNSRGDARRTRQLGRAALPRSPIRVIREQSVAGTASKPEPCWAGSGGGFGGAAAPFYRGPSAQLRPLADVIEFLVRQTRVQWLDCRVNRARAVHSGGGAPN